LLPWALFCRKLLDIVGLFTALQLPAILTLSLPFYILGILYTVVLKKTAYSLPAVYTDKKIKENFSNLDGIGCKVIYEQGPPIYEEMRKYSVIYEETVSHI
jgi:hypothetical protein